MCQHVIIGFIRFQYYCISDIFLHANVHVSRKDTPLAVKRATFLKWVKKIVDFAYSQFTENSNDFSVVNNGSQ